MRDDRKISLFDARRDAAQDNQARIAKGRAEYKTRRFPTLWQ